MVRITSSAGRGPMISGHSSPVSAGESPATAVVVECAQGSVDVVVVPHPEVRESRAHVPKETEPAWVAQLLLEGKRGTQEFLLLVGRRLIATGRAR